MDKHGDCHRETDSGAERGPKTNRLAAWSLTHWGRIEVYLDRLGFTASELTTRRFYLHALELFIEDHLVDPAQAGVSREEQRRRILFELEAPIVPADEPRATVRASREKSRAAQLQARMTALRRRMAAEQDPGKRLEIKDQLVLLGRQARAEQDAATLDG